jgi:adenylate kinase family enzyme
MKTYKDIGFEIKERIEGHKISPDAFVWNSIEKKLKEKRKKKRVFLFWYFSVAIAVTIIFITTFYSQNFNAIDKINNINLESNKENTIFKQDVFHNKTLPKPINKNDVNNNGYENLKILKNKLNHNDSKPKTTVLNSNSIFNKQTNKKLTPSMNNQHNMLNKKKNLKNIQDQNSNTITRNLKGKTDLKIKKPLINLSTQNLNQNVISEKKIDSILIDKSENTNPETSDEFVKDSSNLKNLRWALNPHIITSTYGAFQSKKFNNFTTSYGISLSYRITKKAYVRLGVNNINLVNTENSIKNKLEYLEVPLELKYLILDKKMNPFLTTGLSYFKLKNNESEFGNILENLNTSLSINLGIGIEYKIMNELYINIESDFKYQLKPLATNADFKPYIFSTSVGIEYRF